ncbi:MAG TPA: anti-sigma factor [Acidimicrobiales bacterium]|nr:anti-sigma factor [Acidimicrobiales bacterium]
MTTAPGHQGHPHDDLAVYALDASTPEERERVEAHIASCPACRDEVDAHRRTMALVVPEPDEGPPPGAWEAIARGVRALGNGHAAFPVPLAPREPAPPPDTARPPAPALAPRAPLPDVPLAGPPGPSPDLPRDALAVPPGLSSGPRRAASFAGPPGMTPVSPADASPVGPSDASLAGPPDELASRRAGRSARPRWLLLAAAAVVVVVGAVGFLGTARDVDDGDDGDVVAAARSAAEDPGAAVATLAAGGTGGDVVARVVVDGEDAYVLDEGLADLPEGRTHQVWRIDGGEATSMGTFGAGEEAAELDLGGGKGAEVAITDEPSGGSPTPSGPVVATGALPA